RVDTIHTRSSFHVVSGSQGPLAGISLRIGAVTLPSGRALLSEPPAFAGAGSSRQRCDIKQPRASALRAPPWDHAPPNDPRPEGVTYSAPSMRLCRRTVRKGSAFPSLGISFFHEAAPHEAEA